MARPSKPYFSTEKKKWLVTIKGKRIDLGRDEEKAMKKFHRLMSAEEEIGGEIVNLYRFSQVYLSWLKKNRKEATYLKVRRSLKSFIEHVGKRLYVASLRGHHITKWLEANPGWQSPTTQNINVRCVNEMLNWGVAEGYFDKNPIRYYKKPAERTRDAYYSNEQCSELLAAVKKMRGDVGVLVEFLLETGSRPQEVRLMQGRHLKDDTCFIPAEEGKMGQERTIYPNNKALAILRAQREKRETDNEYLFLNDHGKMFTKDTIINAFKRAEKTIGWKARSYDLRHTWCTNALMDGLDCTAVVQLMGHKDPEMVMKVYSKLQKNPGFLREQANRVRNVSPQVPEESQSSA